MQLPRRTEVTGILASAGDLSRAVAGDPYELRIHVPAGFTAKRVELSAGLAEPMSRRSLLGQAVGAASMAATMASTRVVLVEELSTASSHS